jgi:DNA-binding transcriptional MerR regulator
MVAEHTTNLSLEALSAEVASRLDEIGLTDAQQDHRVSAVPDARTIRYYTTLGLLDRPKMEGRQARYGNRHVLQLLAIKALQGAALPLSEIQARLYGRSDQELESLLASFSAEPRTRKRDDTIHPLIWREVVIEPGLKLMVEGGWAPKSSSEEIEHKIRAVLSALQNSSGSNGGFHDEQDGTR